MINKTWYWILSFTWGLPLTLIGCWMALFALISGYKPKKWLYGYYFEVSDDWGLNLGPFSFGYINSGITIKNHEFGHSIQNCVWGFLCPFVIVIPSALRFWYRRLVVHYGFKEWDELPDYDAIWFEGDATLTGEKYYCYYKGNSL